MDLKGIFMSIFDIFPNAFLYLAVGYAHLWGFSLLVDRRYNYLNDAGFFIMFISGWLIDSIARVIPYDFGLTNNYCRNICIVLFGLVLGVILAIIRNFTGKYINDCFFLIGRRRTSSVSFWYNLLDDTDKVVFLRLKNYEKKYILEGILLSLSETEDNPYLHLGHCNTYDLSWNLICDESSTDPTGCMQKVVRADSFDEITFIYSEGSSKAMAFDFSPETEAE